MQTALNVARWFLQRNHLDYILEDAEYITNLKLQKLLYYAQGVYLGLYGKPLFDEEIEAWKHGPVVPEVYRCYKRFGPNGINEFTPPDCNFTPEELDVLEWVKANFGQYTAWKLRDMTHEEKPWKETGPSNIISKQLIEQYFKENYISE